MKWKTLLSFSRRVFLTNGVNSGGKSFSMNKIIFSRSFPETDTRIMYTSLDVIEVTCRKSGTNEFETETDGFPFVREQCERTFGQRPRCENVSSAPNVVLIKLLTSGDGLITVYRLLEFVRLKNQMTPSPFLKKWYAKRSCVNIVEPSTFRSPFRLSRQYDRIYAHNCVYT